MALTAAASLASLAMFGGTPAQAQAPAANPYGPYEFLIGDWNLGPEGGSPMAVTRFSWASGKSYIRFATSIFVDGVEEPHFEGMLMWNGVRRNLDMLVSLDLKGGRSQEQGTVSVRPDGSVVREITAYFSEGVMAMPDRAVAGPGGITATFRQTFRKLGPDRIETSLMRKMPGGWVPTFPGSAKVIMTRRAA